jgi:hypothetical protein
VGGNGGDKRRKVVPNRFAEGYPIPPTGPIRPVVTGLGGGGNDAADLFPIHLFPAYPFLIGARLTVALEA